MTKEEKEEYKREMGEDYDTGEIVEQEEKEEKEEEIEDKEEEFENDELVLNNHQHLFLESFKATHDLETAYKLLNFREKADVEKSLNTGKDLLYKEYKKFISTAPIHPRANKLSIVNALVKAMDIAIKDEDTAGIVRIVSELNKMNKGNLVSHSQDSRGTQTILGIIDLTKKVAEITEGTVIDVKSKTVEE